MSAGWLAAFAKAIVAIAIATQGAAVRDAALTNPNAPLRAEALRGGGYVIFIRHAHADVGSDATPFDLADCSRQRNLSETGKRDAQSIGEGMRAQRVPVGDVFSSEYCRALDTARLAFGRVQPAAGLNNCCLDGRPLSEEDRRRFLLRALTTPPPLGTNTVLIGHAYFTETDLAMGEAAIYLPDGRGGALRVARVLPGEWANGIYRPGGKVLGQTELAPAP